MRGNENTFPKELRTSVEKNLVALSRLAATQFRLDAPAFLSQEHLAVSMPSTLESQPLSVLADVFTVYIQSPILAYVLPFAQSRPYMTTSELAEYQTRHAPHVSLIADPRLLEWQIKQGTIVVSRSGRVGEAYWVDRKLDGALVGDSFRVVPKNPSEAPLIFAVLASSFARSFLSGSAYGSVVDHASLAQLRSFRVPQLTPATKEKIADMITKALVAREKAYQLLDQTQESILTHCDLPPLSGHPGLVGGSEIIPVMVASKDLVEAPTGRSDLRLEAHFYNAAARNATANILKCPCRKRTIGDVTKKIGMSPLFVRNYVTRDHGVPYIAGKQISQIRPEFKFISRTETQDLEEHILHAGWTLMTCAGTVGKIGYVSPLLDGAAAQDVMRIVPDDREVDGGYLNAWLASEYGRVLIERCKYGSVVDRISPSQTASILIPLPSHVQQKDIGDKVRLAYEQRTEALRFEDEAQEALMRELSETGAKEN